MLNRPGRALELPYSIRGLAVDLNADTLRKTVVDAAAITVWPDDTKGGNDVGNAGSSRPTFDASNPQFNGHASVNFAKASTQYLIGSSLPITTALSGTGKLWTAFIVYRRPTKVSSYECLLSLGNSGSSVNYQQVRWSYKNNNSQRPDVSCRDGAGAGDSNFQGDVELVDLSAELAVVVRGAAAMTHRVVGASQNPRYDVAVPAGPLTASGEDYANQGLFTHDQLCIGVLGRSTISSHCDVEIARVLIYTRELSERESAIVAGYLWNKYCRKTSLITDGLIHRWTAAGPLGVDGDACNYVLPKVGAISLSTPGADATRPTIRNYDQADQYLEFDGSDDYMVAGAASDWPFLHDGSDFSLFLVYRPKSDAAALTPLVDTLDNDPTNNSGLGVYHDGASDAHSVQFKIGATNATAVLDHDSQDGGARPDAWHVLHITCEASHPSSEEDYQLWIDNENYAAIDEGVTPDTGDPSYPLTIGALAGLGTHGQFDFAELLIYDRKLGRPGESQAVAEYLAAEWNTSHVAVAAGNGLAGVLNDLVTPHRAFPGLVWANGRWLCCYRLATNHGASAGVCAMTTSVDGVQWSKERVIFDDSVNYDWRGVNFIGRISTGRIFIGMALSETDSGLLPYTSSVLYSDNRGVTWSGPLFLSKDSDSWFDGLGSDTGLTWDEGVNSVVELGDGSLLAHFSALVAGAVYPHILQCRSTDGGDTWSEPEAIYYGRQPGLGDFPQDERIQEPNVVRFADGELLMAIRADTPSERIYFARSSDDGASWSPSAFTTEYIDGWGNPRMTLDENERVYLFHRLNSSPNIAVWRYSDDRGVTWSDPQPLSNLNDGATTTLPDYGTGMTYASPALDGDGDVRVALGLEVGDDGDVFVRFWHKRRSTKAVALANASNQYLTVSHSPVWDVSDAGFTACGWVYLDLTGAQYIAGKYAAAGTREWVLYLTASGYLAARLSADGTTATVFTSTLAVSNVGQWYFVSLRHDPNDPTGALTLNVDDATKQQTEHIGGMFSGAAAMRLGASDISLVDSLDGRMDRWGFWSRALTDAELEAIRNGGTGVEYRDLKKSQKTSLIAFYDLGQYSGNRADSSGNGQHLTPVNGPTNARGV